MPSKTKQLGGPLREAPSAVFCLLAPEHRELPGDAFGLAPGGSAHREAPRCSSFES
jgi:hypothetical protein